MPIKVLIGGLYTPWPVPAHQVLVAAKEHIAIDVLLCLISHMGLGKNTNCVWPSITTICKYTGRSRKSVVSGTRTLKEYGFIKVYLAPTTGKRKQNKYYIQQSCYHFEMMNKKSTEFTRVVGQCKRCNKIVHESEVGVSAAVHYGCGGQVKLLEKVKKYAKYKDKQALAEHWKFILALTSCISREPVRPMGRKRTDFSSLGINLLNSYEASVNI